MAEHEISDERFKGEVMRLLNNLIEKVGSHDQKFDSIDKRFDSLEKRFDRLEEKVGALSVQITEIGLKFRKLTSV